MKYVPRGKLWLRRANIEPDDAVPFVCYQAATVLGGLVEVGINFPSPPAMIANVNGLRIWRYWAQQAAILSNALLKFRVYRGGVIDREYPFTTTGAPIDVNDVFNAGEVPDLRVANITGTTSGYMILVRGWFF